MLWRKHWRETRWVAGFAAMVLLALGAWMLREIGTMRRQYVPGNPMRGIAASYAMMPVSFREAGPYLFGFVPLVLFVTSILLGIGGLGYERNAGTTTFTLSLPFTRREFVLNRFLVGGAILAGLAAGTLIGSWGWVEYRGMAADFSLARAFAAGICLAAGALAVYAFTFLSANVTANPVRTVATVVTLVLAFGIGIMQLGPGPNEQPERWSSVWIAGQLSPERLIMDAFRDRPMPWLSILIAMAATVAFVTATVRWVERFDF